MSTSLARQRLSQLFKFFKAVEERRTPLITQVQDHRWVLWLDTLPRHQNVKLHKASRDSGEWLSVIKPVLTPCPKPPAVLDSWLRDGWDDPAVELASVYAEQPQRQEDTLASLAFDASAGRVMQLRGWTTQRSIWRQLEVPVREVAGIWGRMFSLHNDLKRDGESWELILGDGLVSHTLGQAPVYHPIVLRKVEQTFDPVAMEFKFIDSDARPELFTPAFAANLFASLPIKKWQESLELEDLHPLDGDNLNYWLRGLAGSIEQGEFIESAPAQGSRQPLFGRGSVLFLRSRATGRVQFIDEILAHLPEAETFTGSLLSIVGITPPPEPLDDEPVAGAYANEQADVLLTKPANTEQVAILRRLGKCDGVLVQGPPGTGKTHTIANLIGNFLAEGKTVLVTSHTTKALRVVRSQVPKPLQSLCVSILDSDKQSRVERELAIRELASRLGDNPNEYRTKAARLRNRRDELLQALQMARAELLTAVHGEYIPIVVGGRETDPALAAREVTAGIGVHDWLPGPVFPTAPAPLSESEAELLLQRGKRICIEDEAELAGSLPTLDSLPTDKQFSAWVDEFNDVSQVDLEFRKDLWSECANAGLSLDLLHQQIMALVVRLQQLEVSPWKLAVIQAGMESGQTGQIWQLLCENIDDVRRKGQSVANILYKFGPELMSDCPLDEQLRVLQEIDSYLKSNISISRFRLTVSPKWKRFIERWKVNGRAPSNIDDFQGLRELAVLAIERRMLGDRWGRLMVPLNVPRLENIDINPEDYAFQYAGQIQSLLSWYGVAFRPVEVGLVAQGLAWSKLLEEAPPATTAYHLAERVRHTVERVLPNVVAAELWRRRLAELNEQFATVQTRLAAVQARRQVQSVLTRALTEAVNSRSSLMYGKAWQQLRELQTLRPLFDQRGALLLRLRPMAPDWADMLAARQSNAAPERHPLEFGAAWRWIQLTQELDRRAALSPQIIQERIGQLTEALQGATIELVEQLAWGGLLRKVTDEQRQALGGWAQTMKRVGAGTGKLVPALLRQARSEMEKARGAVPVWIMPFSHVTSSFHPVRDKFDVIIVDEASQEDVLGLATFYMAQKVIVVGDDEQVTPLDVGGLQEPIQHLIGQWLVDLPGHRLFDLKTSVYDRAQIAFGSAIRLKEHFRCVPEIIQFSNALCYDFTINPLRESASSALKPALVAHRVEGQATNKVNLAEVHEIVSLIRACLERREYANKTFGVITMVGDRQADLIGDLLRDQIDPAAYEHRRILCGNPAQFQGDERDVIFLSLVDSKEDGEGPLSMRQDGTDGMWKKRFNVAASRAKDQLWVIYSVDHKTQLKPADLRRRLIEHAIDPSALMDRLHSGVRKTESPFEAEVLTILTAQGYHVRPQWQVGAYRIDMVVEGNGKRLAIECDGERWHYDKVEEDLARQALLERLGWTFVRLRGSSFYRDSSPHRAIAMRPIYQKLQDFGIQPAAENGSEKPAADTDLVDAIRRRAFEIKNNNTTDAGVSKTKDGHWLSIASKPLTAPKTDANLTKMADPKHLALGSNSAVPTSAPLNKSPSADRHPSGNSISNQRFQKGMCIAHSHFGLGTVVSIQMFGEAVDQLEIKFDGHHELKLIKPTGTNINIVRANNYT